MIKVISQSALNLTKTVGKILRPLTQNASQQQHLRRLEQEARMVSQTLPADTYKSIKPTKQMQGKQPAFHLRDMK